jgi:SulP family sulfate permease
MRLPITAWLPRYRASRLRGDGVGALTAWAIVVPESVAYAQIAGVPPQNAFYAAPVALVAYAVFGSSRHLIVGATSAAAILSASTVAVVSPDPGRAVALSAALAIVAGVILIGAGLLRLGFVTNFLPEPALVGFLFGMALIIVVRQAGKLVGVSTGDGDFFQRAWHLLSQVGSWSLATMAVGLGAVAALLLLERYAPKVPASLVVLAAGIALSALLDLDQHGVEIVGTIPPALPTLAVPDVSANEVAGLLGGGFGLALIVFAESFSISSRFARQHGYEVDADQEMVAMGAANATAGLFQGFAVSGSASRTAATEGAGGASQMVSLLAAVLVLVTAAFLTPLFTDLPEPVLAAIVIVAVRGFLRLAPLRRYWRLDRRSFWVAMAALLGTLVFDLLPGAADRGRAVAGVVHRRRQPAPPGRPRPAGRRAVWRPGRPSQGRHRPRPAAGPPGRAGVLRQRQPPAAGHPPAARHDLATDPGGRPGPDQQLPAQPAHPRHPRRAPRRAPPTGDRPVAGPDPRRRHGRTPSQRPSRPARTGPGPCNG